MEHERQVTAVERTEPYIAGEAWTISEMAVRLNMSRQFTAEVMRVMVSSGKIERLGPDSFRPKTAMKKLLRSKW